MAVAVCKQVEAPEYPRIGVEGYNVPVPHDENKHIYAALMAIKNLLEFQFSATSSVAIANISVLFHFLRTVLFPATTNLPQLALTIVSMLCSSDDMIKTTARMSMM